MDRNLYTKAGPPGGPTIMRNMKRASAVLVCREHSGFNGMTGSVRKDCGTCVRVQIGRRGLHAP